MKSYWPGIIFSVTAHTILVVMVVWGWQAAQHPKAHEVPRYVRAELIELKEQAKPEVNQKKKDQEKAQKKKRQEALRKKQEAERKKKAEKEKAKQLALKKAKAEKARKEKERKEKERKEKERKEKERKEKERKEKELREKQEKKRKEELLKEIERERKRERDQAVAAEKARKAAERQLSEDEKLVASYNSVIHDRVSDSWSRPPSARNGMEVSLRIQLVPTGEVIGVDIIKSSGDSAFDRSAIRAVKKAERFPEIKEIPGRIFEKYFRTFTLIFSPEDLRQ